MCANPEPESGLKDAPNSAVVPGHIKISLTSDRCDHHNSATVTSLANRIQTIHKNAQVEVDWLDQINVDSNAGGTSRRQSPLERDPDLPWSLRSSLELEPDSPKPSKVASNESPKRRRSVHLMIHSTDGDAAFYVGKSFKAAVGHHACCSRMCQRVGGLLEDASVGLHEAITAWPKLEFVVLLLFSPGLASAAARAVFSGNCFALSISAWVILIVIVGGVLTSSWFLWKFLRKSAVFVPSLMISDSSSDSSGSHTISRNGWAMADAEYPDMVTKAGEVEKKKKEEEEKEEGAHISGTWVDRPKISLTALNTTRRQVGHGAAQWYLRCSSNEEKTKAQPPALRYTCICRILPHPYLWSPLICSLVTCFRLHFSPRPQGVAQGPKK